MRSDPNPGARQGIQLLNRFFGLKIRARLSRFPFCDVMTSILVYCFTLINI
jgi:hypothetical protein